MKNIDNTSTLLGDDLKTMLKNGATLRVAAPRFSIHAWEALRAAFQHSGEMRFIFTEPTFTTGMAAEGRQERREFFIPRRDREASIAADAYELHLRNRMTQRAVARDCGEWIDRKATFQSNADGSGMQCFFHVESGGEQSVYMPTGGFTMAGLGYERGNAVSNLMVRLDGPAAAGHRQVFDDVWNDPARLNDVTEALRERITSVYRENAPERLYFGMLNAIFGDFLEDLDERSLPKDGTGYADSLVWKKLFNFQRDAATGIVNKLETFNGCILADSVGLGKTFTALAVIKYYELRNDRVLVLCPKKLAPNWTTYNNNLRTNLFADDRFAYDVLCHTDLSRDRGESLGIALDQVRWENYDLVVIDESHNFRNNDAYTDRETRYQRLLNRVMRAGVKTKVLMLSATPVNNRFVDLRNQLALAYEGEGGKLAQELGLKGDIDEVFRRAQTAFNAWTDLPPEERTTGEILKRLDFDFFKLLDAVTISRSRKHIETFYDTSEIGRFPTRLPPISHRTPITAQPDVMALDAIFEQLGLLTLSVYAPMSFVLESRRRKYEEIYDTRPEGRGTLRQADREKSLRALMTVNLLKRLESSVHAFRLTLRALAGRIDTTLDAIARFEDAGAQIDDEAFAEELMDLGQEDDDIARFGDFKVGTKVRIDLADMDVPSWKRDLTGDRALIEGLLADMDQVTPEHDAKRVHLEDAIAAKHEAPLNPGNRKVIVFTAFADTANYLYDTLAPDLAAQGVHVARVTGSGPPKTTLGPGYGLQEVLTLFSPRSKEKDKTMPDVTGEIDLLIATDCISEGQNLQDCDMLINYDIHWNPVRIVQRFGRIDRIGSPNERIQLVNYWPDISLDAYINLRERVEDRMVIVDMAGTGDDNVLSAKSNDIAYRREQLRRLQDEVIEVEDARGGLSITDMGLNDFRMDLLGHVKKHGPLNDLPPGMHAVVPARPDLGLVPGTLFLLRRIDGEAGKDALNVLHPHYLVFMGTDGAVQTDHTKAKRLLDLVRAACKGYDTPVEALCRIFNARTGDGREMGEQSALLDAAIRSMVAVKEERDIDSLFSGTPISAKVQGGVGRDDFELVAFIVVEPAAEPSPMPDPV